MFTEKQQVQFFIPVIPAGQLTMPEVFVSLSRLLWTNVLRSITATIAGHEMPGHAVLKPRRPVRAVISDTTPVLRGYCE